MKIKKLPEILLGVACCFGVGLIIIGVLGLIDLILKTF